MALRDVPQLLQAQAWVVAEQRNATVIFLASAVVLALSFLWWRFSRVNTPFKPLPPGRFGLPLIGETLGMLKHGPYAFIQNHISEFGDIFKTSLFGSPTVFIPSVAGNKFLLANEYRLVRVAWPSSVVSVLGRRSLVALDSHESKTTRQAFTAFLKPEALRSYTEKADRTVRAFLSEHWQGRQQVRVLHSMKHVLFSLVCELLMGRYGKEDQQLLEVQFTAMMKGIFQLPIRLPWTRFGKALKGARFLRHQMQIWMVERRRDIVEGRAAAHQDLLSCLLTFKNEDGEALTDEDITDNLLLVLLAGHDTTTALMTMVCKFLAEHPALLEEMWKENKEIAEKKGPDEPLNWKDLQRMKLSWRVVQETLRLQPPVGAAFRVALKEFEYNGFRIPKDWKLSFNIAYIHKSPEYYHDPLKFDPSRFEGAGPAPYTFVPFGGGPRMCLGNEFARMAALVLFHHLALGFTWSLVDPSEEILIDPMPHPTKGLPIYLKPRPRQQAAS